MLLEGYSNEKQGLKWSASEVEVVADQYSLVEGYIDRQLIRGRFFHLLERKLARECRILTVNNGISHLPTLVANAGYASYDTGINIKPEYDINLEIHEKILPHSSARNPLWSKRLANSLRNWKIDFNENPCKEFVIICDVNYTGYALTSLASNLLSLFSKYHKIVPRIHYASVYQWYGTSAPVEYSASNVKKIPVLPWELDSTVDEAENTNGKVDHFLFWAAPAWLANLSKRNNTLKTDFRYAQEIARRLGISEQEIKKYLSDQNNANKIGIRALQLLQRGK